MLQSSCWIPPRSIRSLEMTDTTTPSRAYTVHGMTCDHCAAAVNEEVSGLAGVDRVDVDRASGRLEITGEQASEEEIRAAVEEAGYELAGER
jgi:copper chaperone CopZ